MRFGEIINPGLIIKQNLKAWRHELSRERMQRIKDYRRSLKMIIYWHRCIGSSTRLHCFYFKYFVVLIVTNYLHCRFRILKSFILLLPLIMIMVMWFKKWNTMTRIDHKTWNFYFLIANKFFLKFCWMYSWSADLMILQSFWENLSIHKTSKKPTLFLAFIAEIYWSKISTLRQIKLSCVRLITFMSYDSTWSIIMFKR